MKELLVLVVGFVAATKLWLAAYDLNIFRKAPDRAHVTRAFRAMGRIGVAVTTSILAWRLAGVPAISPEPITFAYLLGSLILLVGTVGELNTYDWEDDTK